MTTRSRTHIRITPSLQSRIDAFFGTIGFGCNPYEMRMARWRELHALDAKSDAELALMGLSRADIPAHVFRDLIA
ncbi:MAG: hypothetical protein ACPGID_08675 [Rubricella sp.]